jgi:hypothetical protein
MSSYIFEHMVSIVHIINIFIYLIFIPPPHQLKQVSLSIAVPKTHTNYNKFKALKDLIFFSIKKPKIISIMPNIK